MPSRKSSEWQPRTNQSLGKLRRAHPASGATWNVQVVRGKMTSKCLWHACRALAIGMVLMLLGAGMATIGYYADQLSVGQEIRGNATVRVKNESRGFHLNNLSYAGPIVMGFGGFIVVAACVMTFEARDSAGKVVPARLKVTGSNRSNTRSNNSSGTSTRRANGTMHQSNRWDHHLGVFRTSPAEPKPPQLDRQALTAALIHFSKAMGSSPRQSPKSRRFSRSGSVPNLASSHRSSINSTHLSPYRKQLLQGHSPHHHHHHQHHHHHGRHGLSHSRNSRISISLVNRASRESTGSLLHPGMLHYHRHALSVDETGPYFSHPTDSPNGSQCLATVADSHEGRVRDRTRRSDTSKRHVLARQKPIEKEEPHSPKQGCTNGRRRSSTASDASYASRRIYRRTSSTSRTPSIDSRSVQVELHSPDQYKSSPRTPRRINSGPSSTPSVEREFRSQLSVCSDSITARQLSGQSSLEPCVLEESPEFEDKEPISEMALDNIESHRASPTPKKSRPESLNFDVSNEKSKATKSIEVKKFLYRSNSSKTFYRPKPKLINDYDQVYFISTNGTTKNTNSQDEDLYDSLRVINERRKKILSSSELEKSRTIQSESSKDDMVAITATPIMIDESDNTKNTKHDVSKCNNTGQIKENIINDNTVTARSAESTTKLVMTERKPTNEVNEIVVRENIVEHHKILKNSSSLPADSEVPLSSCKSSLMKIPSNDCLDTTIVSGDSFDYRTENQSATKQCNSTEIVLEIEIDDDGDDGVALPA